MSMNPASIGILEITGTNGRNKARRKRRTTVKDISDQVLKRKDQAIFKAKESRCKKLILPMSNPKAALNEIMVNYPSTLHKPVGNEIRTVPKEILDLEGKPWRKRDSYPVDVKKFDPLVKYRKANVGYLSRSGRNLTTKFEGREMTEEEQQAIINFRFELLRRLNEEFRKLHHNTNHPNSQRSSFDKVPHTFDKPPATSPAKADVNAAVKQGVNKKDVNGEMNATTLMWKLKQGEKVKYTVKAAKIVGNKRSNSAGGRKDGKYDGGKNESKSKDGDGNGSGTRGPVRKYCTAASDEGCKKKIIAACKAAEPKEEKAKEEPKINTDFDIIKATPQAFTCPSQQLAEQQQQNLYNRYHPYSFFEFQGFLHEKRAFSIDKAAQDKKAQENKKKC